MVHLQLLVARTAHRLCALNLHTVGEQTRDLQAPFETVLLCLRQRPRVTCLPCSSRTLGPEHRAPSPPPPRKLNSWGVRSLITVRPASGTGSDLTRQPRPKAQRPPRALPHVQTQKFKCDKIPMSQNCLLLIFPI